MSIKVRYFASLAERLGRSEATLEFTPGWSVKDVWHADNPNETLPGNILAAANMDYAEPDALINDGDEVAFFPPVTGG